MKGVDWIATERALRRSGRDGDCPAPREDSVSVKATSPSDRRSADLLKISQRLRQAVNQRMSVWVKAGKAQPGQMLSAWPSEADAALISTRPNPSGCKP